MSTGALLAMLLVGGGAALFIVGFLSRAYEREERLADILDLPYGEQDVDLGQVVDQHSSLVEKTIGLAAKMIDQVDAKGALLTQLEKARVPLRPGEFVIVVASAGVVLGAFLAAITSKWIVGGAAALATPFLARAFLKRRITKRRKKFENQFPDALTLIESSLSAGHTFLRAI